MLNNNSYNKLMATYSIICFIKQICVGYPCYCQLLFSVLRILLDCSEQERKELDFQFSRGGGWGHGKRRLHVHALSLCEEMLALCVVGAAGAKDAVFVQQET